MGYFFAARCTKSLGVTVPPRFKNPPPGFVVPNAAKVAAARMRVPPQKAPPPQLWLQPVLPPPAPPAKAAEAAPAKAVEVAPAKAVELAGVTEAAEGVTGAVEELPPPPPPPKCLGFS